MLEKIGRGMAVPVHVTVFQSRQGIFFPLVVLRPGRIYLVLLLFLLLFLFKRFKKGDVIFINNEGKVSEGQKQKNQQGSLKYKDRRSLSLILTDKITREMPVIRTIHHLFSKIKLHATLDNFPILSNFALIVRLPSNGFLLLADLNLYPSLPLTSSTILTTFHPIQCFLATIFLLSFPLAMKVRICCC